MHQYYRDLGLYVIGYNNSAEVLSAEPIQGTRNIAVTVYEWTWLFHSDKSIRTAIQYGSWDFLPPTIWSLVLVQMGSF